MWANFTSYSPSQSVPSSSSPAPCQVQRESLTRAHWQCLNHHFQIRAFYILQNTYTHYPVATDLNCCRSQSMLAFDSAEKTKQKTKNRGPRRERHVTDSVEIDLRLPYHPCCQAKTSSLRSSVSGEVRGLFPQELILD